jgi:hypothetical protein
MKSILKISLVYIYLFFLIVNISCQKEEKGTPTEQRKTGQVEVDIDKIENEALEAANSWLKLVDAGEYSKSWEESAKLFKGVISKDKWENTLNGVRKPLGGLIKREVISEEYMTSLPGAPDGEYVVIQYNTSFENKKDALETVTPMKDEDGVWRVSGYYIK